MLYYNAAFYESYTTRPRDVLSIFLGIYFVTLKYFPWFPLSPFKRGGGNNTPLSGVKNLLLLTNRSAYIIHYIDGIMTRKYNFYMF